MARRPMGTSRGWESVGTPYTFIVPLLSPPRVPMPLSTKVKANLQTTLWHSRRSDWNMKRELPAPPFGKVQTLSHLHQASLPPWYTCMCIHTHTHTHTQC
jgi:hypothetical protein